MGVNISQVVLLAFFSIRIISKDYERKLKENPQVMHADSFYSLTPSMFRHVESVVGEVSPSVRVLALGLCLILIM